VQVVQRPMNQGVTLHNLLHNLHNLTTHEGLDMVEPEKPQLPRTERKILELIDEQIDRFAGKIVPNGDIDEHYEFHKRVIDKKRASEELRDELIRKGILWAAGAICTVLGLALWEYLKHSLAK